MTKARKIVGHMLANDAFSRWLGIELKEIKPGYCELSMMVRDEMTNGFKIAHGGIAYSLADSALAFASNAHGRMAYSIHTEIEHLEKILVGETIVAIAEEISLKNKIGIYSVKILQQSSLKAMFKGMVYLTEKTWDI